jgi:hypothetical protein
MSNNKELASRVNDLEKLLKELMENSEEKKPSFTIPVSQSGLSEEEVKQILALKK